MGHQFFSRAEMVALGFHGHWLNGIDYIGQSYGKVQISPIYLRKGYSDFLISSLFYSFKVIANIHCCFYRTLFLEIIYLSYFVGFVNQKRKESRN